MAHGYDFSDGCFLWFCKINAADKLLEQVSDIKFSLNEPHAGWALFALPAGLLPGSPFAARVAQIPRNAVWNTDGKS